MEQQERREVVLRKSKKPIERRDNNSADQVTGQQEEYQDDNDSTGTREEMDEGDIPPTKNDDAEHVCACLMPWCLPKAFHCHSFGAG